MSVTPTGMLIGCPADAIPTEAKKLLTANSHLSQLLPLILYTP